MTESANPRLYSVAQAAQALAISKSTLRGHVKAGTIKPVRVGRRVLFAPAELDRIVKRGLPSLAEVA